MTKTKSTKGTASKRTKATSANAEAKAVTPKSKESRAELCVFAFRLTEAERDAIHKAAGPAKASKFARRLLVAAAQKDAAAVKAIMEGGKMAE